MYDEVVKLIKQTNSVDDYGDTVTQEVETEAFCKLKSIGQTEFYQAQANGLRPEIKFILADYLDYSGEQIIEYTPYYGEAERYSVIRSYRSGNQLELTCHRGVIE